MELKEAREIMVNIGNEKKETIRNMALTFDNRIYALETQRDEVLEILKNLCDYIAPLGSIAGEPFKIAQHILNK